MDGDIIRRARIALGGVAHKPWRLEEAEELLSGKRAEPECFAAAADRLLQGAQPLADNAFKIDLARRAIVRALTEAAGRSEEHTSELQSLMRISYAVFCLKKKKK